MRCTVSLRALPPQSPVGTVAVVVLPPLFKDASGFGQGHEDILVQAFIPQPAVETFHETLICRFPWSAVLQAHAMFLRPFIQGPASELRTIVRAKASRQMPFPAQAFQHLHHPLAGKRYIRLQYRI